MANRRVVLDTNILVSAILFGGKPRLILDDVIAGRIACFLSSEILDELNAVLQRPKFGFTAIQRLDIIDELRRTCEIIQPSSALSVQITDPDDRIILECAIDANADYIISGDTDLKRLHPFNGIQILAPALYLERTREKYSA
jgi:putative PIN family toxin of toxin-antitoxin system